MPRAHPFLAALGIHFRGFNPIIPVAANDRVSGGSIGRSSESGLSSHRKSNQHGFAGSTR